MLHPIKDYDHIQDPTGKIPENEPVFLLRGQDKIASMLVRVWAAMNRELGGDWKLTQAAYEHADKMDAWPSDPEQQDGPEQPGGPEQQCGPELPSEAAMRKSQSIEQGDKTKSDAANRRTAGNSPW